MAITTSSEAEAARNQSLLLLLGDLRGGKLMTAQKDVTNVGHEKHGQHLMSPTAAVANILADLCPHGMLPIGTSPSTLVVYEHNI
jgi:hypothetical protein